MHKRNATKLHVQVFLKMNNWMFEIIYIYIIKLKHLYKSVHYIGFYYILKWSVRLVMLYVDRLPKNGTMVPKHIGDGTYYKLCFVICILSYFIKVLFHA